MCYNTIYSGVGIVVYYNLNVSNEKKGNFKRIKTHLFVNNSFIGIKNVFIDLEHRE